MVHLDFQIKEAISEKCTGLKEFKGLLETTSDSTVNTSGDGTIAVGVVICGSKTLGLLIWLQC